MHFVRLAHLGRISVNVEVGDQDVDDGDQVVDQLVDGGDDDGGGGGV